MRKIKRRMNKEEKFLEQIKIEKANRPSKTKIYVTYSIAISICVLMVAMMICFLVKGLNWNNKYITIYFLSLVVLFLILRYIVKILKKWEGFKEK